MVTIELADLEEGDSAPDAIHDAKLLELLAYHK